MKKVIEKIVKQEIRDILAKNEDTIKEIVNTSLLPELKAAVRDSISKALEDLIVDSPEIVNTQQAGDDKRPQVSEEVQNPKTDLPPDIGLRPVGAYAPEGHWPPARRGLRPGGTLDIGSASGRYLYCIVEGSESMNFGKIGIEGSEVYTIPYNDLCAVVHNCPAEPYQSEDKEIVKPWLVAHQKVVDAAWKRFGTVLPMGFDTIIRGNAAADPEENMKTWLKEAYENLVAKMEKVRGGAEYGVQVFWDSKVMAQKITEESVEIKKLDEEINSKPRGQAYMYRQKLEAALKSEMEKQADQYFKDFYERIKLYVDDLHVEKTKKTEDENKQMLMNLSCLLPKDGSQELGDELEKIDALEGFSVRYTGPWPPYSFV
ncbi:MAG: gas vesicle protein GvpL [Pseudomonadota bacterium]